MKESPDKNPRDIKKGLELRAGWQDSSETTNESKLRYLKSFLKAHEYPIDTRTKILEIGSGNAGLLDMLNGEGLSAVGVDIAPRGPQGSPQVLARIERMPFEDGAFDVVFSAQAFDDTMYHQDQPAMLGEVARVLKAGGHFVTFGDYLAINTALPENFQKVKGIEGAPPVYQKIS